MDREAASSKSPSSPEKSTRIYLLLAKIIGLVIAALGVIFFLLTFNLAILIILAVVGIILFVIGNRQL